MNEYLTVAQLADLLQLHQTTVYRLMTSGEIPFVKIGPGSVRFIRSDIDAWAESKKTPQTQKNILTATQAAE